MRYDIITFLCLVFSNPLLSMQCEKSPRIATAPYVSLDENGRRYCNHPNCGYIAPRNHAGTLRRHIMVKHFSSHHFTCPYQEYGCAYVCKLRFKAINHIVHKHSTAIDSELYALKCPHCSCEDYFHIHDTRHNKNEAARSLCKHVHTHYINAHVKSKKHTKRETKKQASLFDPSSFLALSDEE